MAKATKSPMHERGRLFLFRALIFLICFAAGLAAIPIAQVLVNQVIGG